MQKGLEINFYDMFRQLRKKWAVLLAFVLIFAVAADFYGYHKASLSAERERRGLEEYAQSLGTTVDALPEHMTVELAEEANGLWFTSGSNAGVIENGVLVNKVTGLYRSTDSRTKVIRSIAKYGSISELQDDLAANFGITDFSDFDFTLEDNGELLEYPISYQEFIMFNAGVRSSRVDVWQNLPSPGH